MKKFKALGCHIYSGAQTIGMLDHFEVVAHFEEWNFGVETVRQNLKIPVYVGKPGEWPVDDFKGKVDYVYGNPPCAPWSQGAGRDGGAWRGDPRVQHWVNVLELLDRLQPKVWTCESVRGIYNRGRSFLEPFVIRASKKGYRATHLLVNALEHGVPQSRPRYFLVLSKVDLTWMPTGLKKDVTIEEVWKRAFRTSTEVELKKPIAKLIKKARPGEDLRATFNREVPADQWKPNAHGGVAGRPPFSYKRLREEGIAHVITGGRNFIHPVHQRFLTVEEQAALCGYPRGYRFSGPPHAQYPQIGKAVMPPVARYLGGIIAHGLRRNKKPKVLSPEEVTITRQDVTRRDVEKFQGPIFEVPAPVAKPPAYAKAKAYIKKSATASGSHVTRMGSGYRIRQMLVEGKPTETILKIIHKEFPMSKATGSDVSWNRAKLAAQGGSP